MFLLTINVVISECPSDKCECIDNDNTIMCPSVQNFKITFKLLVDKDCILICMLNESLEYFLKSIANEYTKECKIFTIVNCVLGTTPIIRNNFQKLNILIIKSQNFQTIQFSVVIGQLKTLEELRLDNIGFDSISKAFTVSTLSLNHNQITSLANIEPATLDMLESTNNNLSSINLPESVNVKILNLMNTNISDDPILFIEKHKSFIENLVLKDGTLQDVGEDQSWKFDKTSKNVSIVNSRNTLNAISKSLLSELINLKSLHLKIGLEDIPEWVKNMENLKELDLSENDLQFVPNIVFKKMTKLISVNLAHNSISEIDENAFSNNLKITTLSLHHNQLSKING